MQLLPHTPNFNTVKISPVDFHTNFDISIETFITLSASRLNIFLTEPSEFLYRTTQTH